MASTLTRNLLHITFSTKHRAALIPAAIEPDLYAYTGGICRRMESPLLAMGGTTDHVHMFVSLSKTVALSDLMLDTKRDSSKWMKEKDAAFGWQDGYFAFSVGESGADALRAYIANQKEHTRRSTSRTRCGRSCASTAWSGMSGTCGIEARAALRAAAHAGIASGGVVAKPPPPPATNVQPFGLTR